MTAKRWTAADEERIGIYCERGDMSLSDMAARLQHTQAETKEKLEAMGLMVPVQKYTQRKCLCCGKDFPSAHSMNRMCGYCRSHSVTPFDVGARILA